MMAAVGILAALLERERTGLGGFVDISMLDGVVSWLSIHLGSHLADPSLLQAARPLSGDLACYRMYRCAGGGLLTVGAIEPLFWRTVCETLGRVDLIDDQYAAPERQTQMAAELEAIFVTRPRDEWMETFAHLPACVGPVNDLSEAIADPQVRHRSMIAEIDGLPVGPGSPLKMGPRTGTPLPAPGLGEHTEEVLIEAGLTLDAVRHLQASGVV
jgi:crotonobetainyl-CoA:carnitine CoA-transferase CaiB-like acyl-CoA transferase